MIAFRTSLELKKLPEKVMDVSIKGDTDNVRNAKTSKTRLGLGHV